MEPILNRSEAAVCLRLGRVIPPELQAEADELAAALSELQKAIGQEAQEVVGTIL